MDGDALISFLDAWSLYFVFALLVLLYFEYVFEILGRVSKKTKDIWTRVRRPLSLSRSLVNPLLAPRLGSFWESEAVFNPAAVILDGRVHLLYRAIGGDGISRWGYASSQDGVHFDTRLPFPVFAMHKHPHMVDDRTYNPVLYPSGGSWGGAEDPRAVVIDSRVYVTFNAFDGWDFIRVGYTSVSAQDFAQRRFYWNTPQLLSPAHQIHKNWVLFPQKINGKFALLHSITPDIQIEYVDSLEDVAFGVHKVHSRHAQKKQEGWEKQLRSAATPPLLTRLGWLLFYHAHDEESHRYKLGAMILDRENPSIVLHKASSPVLSPDAWYENEWKVGIIYACGAVIKDGELLVYYGGGDRTVNVARADLDQFLLALSQERAGIFSLDKVTT